MQFSTYMTNIVSEVKSFGKAYVDSLVAPQDDEYNKKERSVGTTLGSASDGTDVGHSSVGALGDVLSNLVSTASPFGSCLMDDNDDANSAGGLSKIVEHGTMCSHNTWESNYYNGAAVWERGTVEQGFAECVSDGSVHPSPLVFKTSPETTEAPLVASTTSLQKKNLKRGNTIRSKFGAVKLVLDTAPTSSSAALTDTASVPQISRRHAEVNMVKLPPTPSPWEERRGAVLQLLNRHANRRSLLVPWARNFLRSFVDSVANQLPPATTEKGLSLEAARQSTEQLPLEGSWNEIESLLRKCLTQAIPIEVWGPCAGSRVEAITTPPKSTPLCSFNNADLSLLLQSSLQSLQQWHHRRQLYSVLVSKKQVQRHQRHSLDHAMEQCMIDMYSSCFFPHIRVAAERAKELLQRCVPQHEEVKGPMQVATLNNSFDQWVAKVMSLFCSELTAADGEWQRRVDHTAGATTCTASDSEDVVDAAVSGVESGTTALWLMCEVAVMSLLLVRTLFCEAE
ncbi:uncharacterized protein TEOVI_000309200 [Trypanosoma equiperdum]|uniref:Uncharacterized protein n=1 Tax=Trypanosoma equiperdum TaxID=5694 RepID=A0A1G4IGH4_TRYEQ|nr:hypothetical protein, conserved [Trypanosoma equiperdum]